MDIGMLGFSIPLIRNNQVTRISDYLVNAATPDSLFESKRALVTDLASESAPDSLMETAGVVIPLSDKERLAFDRIDSTATLDKVFKPEEAVANLLGDHDDDSDRSRWASTLRPFGWFNRVDGFYLSARPRIRSKDRKTGLQTEIGYATAIERWTPGGELWHVWGKRDRFRVSGGYRKGSSPRQTTNLYSNFNAIQAISGGDDYLDHYWRERFYAQRLVKLRSLRLDLVPGVRIEKHRSFRKSTDFAILSDFVQRPNPAIEEGNLRSVTFRATHARGGGPHAIVGQRRLQVHVEQSHPDVFGSDFDFTQIRLYAAWRFKTFFSRRIMPNALDVTIMAGKAFGQLLLQRFGHIDASLERWHNPGTFRSLHANPDEGEHYFSAFWEHHFRTIPFAYLGWDWLVKRNIGIIIYGGHCRTWISDSRLRNLSYTPQYGDQLYHELGASINGLLGLFRLDFTKRLDTSGYTIGFARIL